MSGETFTDAAMLEIFRAEVETHVESLTSGLLALERDPKDTSHIDAMMRGAHSIKGAARIIGIDPAVRVAHVMEDGFIAAQNGKLTLQPEHVDVLLRGVDLLNRIANSSKQSVVDWRQFDTEATSLVSEIVAVLAEIPATSSISARRSDGSSVATPIPESDLSEQPAKSISEITVSVPALLDAVAAETVRLQFVAGLDAGATLIRFDLSMTSDIDAIGLALLAAIPAQVKNGGPRVELVGTRPDLGYVLEVTGIDRMYLAGGR